MGFCGRGGGGGENNLNFSSRNNFLTLLAKAYMNLKKVSFACLSDAK